MTELNFVERIGLEVLRRRIDRAESHIHEWSDAELVEIQHIERRTMIGGAGSDRPAYTSRFRQGSWWSENQACHGKSSASSSASSTRTVLTLTELVASDRFVALDHDFTDRAKQLIAHARAALFVQQMKADIVVFNRRIELDRDGDRDRRRGRRGRWGRAMARR